MPSLATFNPYDMASYGGGKVVKQFHQHQQSPTITLMTLLASLFLGSIISPAATPADAVLKEIIDFIRIWVPSSGGRRPSNILTSCEAPHQLFLSCTEAG